MGGGSITTAELKRRLAMAEDRASAAEAALREGDTRHRLLIESWAQAVWETDAAGVVVIDSPSWRAYTGQTLEEWLGYGWLDAIHADDRAYAERQWREAMAARTLVNAEFRLRAPGGGWRWTNVRAAPVLDAAGNIEKWAGINIDIDERKQAETALRENEERYRSFFESMDEAYAVVEVLKDEGGSWSDFRFLEVNRAFLKHTTMPWPVGKTATELLGSPNPRWTELYGLALDTGEPLRVEEPEATLGIIFDLNIFSLDRDRNRVAVLFTNITERKQAETALRDSEERYRNLFETMRQGYIENELIRDVGGHAIDYLTKVANPQFERLTGIPAGEAVDRTARELVGHLEPIWLETYERVVRTGQPEQFEREEPAFGRWFEVQAYPLTGDRFAILYDDITERRRTTAALRESEERQALLLKLSDALRPLTGADEIQRVAGRIATEHWGMANANYVRIETRHGVPYAIVRDSYAAKGRESVDGDYLLADFPGFTGRMLSGERMMVAEVASDPNLTELDKANWKAMNIATLLSVSLVKGGRLVACFAVHGPEPRTWTIADAQLLEEIAERTWAAVERAGTESALRESEERFQQFADASSGGLWIRDAETFMLEFANRAMSTIYGVHSEASLDDVRHWASMIVPEDRETAFANIARAGRGEPVVHEFRIQRPSDGAFRWIRNTDFPLQANDHVPRIGGIAEDVTEAKLLVEHQAVLLAELQHRVRNIMAILRSIAARTAEGASSVQDYAELIAGRLNTFARVQALLTRAANVGVSMATIVNDELRALAQHEHQFDAEGPDIELSPKAAETMTLAVHELTTNALKYGALSTPDGKITVRWEIIDRKGAPWLSFNWNETGAPERPSSTPRRVGFGSELIEGRIPYELSGRGKVMIDAGGAQCHLEFPLKEGASILETDAPQRAAVFGGAIDMSGEADLTGQRILVVEDDYYLASDTARALRSAGAEVLGPSATEEAARGEMQGEAPTGAVLDINLSAGRSFKLAEELKQASIPFVFVTGYDQEVIPEEFDAIARLQKPVEFCQIVGALAVALGLQS